MRYTLIRNDSTFGVDGEFYVVDMSSLNGSDIRAVQLIDGYGHIELDDLSNKEITDQEFNFTFGKFIPLWEKAKADFLAEKIAQQTDASAIKAGTPIGNQ